MSTYISRAYNMIKDRKEKYFLIPLAAVLMSVLTMAQIILFPNRDFLTLVLVSVIDSIVCYGTVSIIGMKEKGTIFRTQKYFGEIIQLLLIVGLTVITCYFLQSLFFNWSYGLFEIVPEEFRPAAGIEFYEEIEYENWQKFILCLSFGLVIPIYEELFFRGLLIKGYGKVSRRILLIFSTFVFVMSHEDIDLKVFVLPLSIVCADLVLRNHSLWKPIVVHAAVNIVGILKLPVSDKLFSAEYPIHYGERATALTNGLFCLLIVGICGIGLAGLLRGGQMASAVTEEKEIPAYKNIHNYLYIGACVAYVVLLYVTGIC